MRQFNNDIERWRVKIGPMASSTIDGNNGAFKVTVGNKGLTVVASDGMGWDHVSVSRPDRCPTWDEMCAIKDLFFDPEEWVVQYHPAHSAYIEDHPYCLHLWRPQNAELPQPEQIMVGITRKG